MKRTITGWLPKGLKITEAMELTRLLQGHLPLPTRDMCLKTYGPECRPERRTTTITHRRT
jgi:hypothetical protein